MNQSKIISRKVISIVLSLLMVLSCFSGMGLTAFAAGEKAYAAYDVTTETNKTKSGDALTALQVTFNERKWYIIEDNSSSATSGTVTLLSADTTFGTKSFDNNDNSSDKYSTSQVKAYLDSMTGTDGAFADVAEAIETVNLTTNKFDSTDVYETVNGVKLYLLSVEEANSLSENVRKAGFTGGNCEYNEWWLRSPGYSDTSDLTAAFVWGDDGGVVIDGATVDFSFGVRPALQLDLSKVEFDSSSKTFAMAKSAYADYLPAEADDATALAAKVVKFDGMDWYLIEDNSTSETEGTVTLFAKECVGASKFGTNNTYSGSTVETYVNNWYTSNISADAKAAVDGNGMFLLTTAQANAMTADTKKCNKASGAETNIWWLCSTGRDDRHAAFVYGGSGYVDGTGYDVQSSLGVRPALKLDLSKVEFDSETNTFAVVKSAYADYLPAATDDATALAAKVVKFNGYNWYLIEDNSTSETEGTVTLFAADDGFGLSKFSDSYSNAYSSSKIKAALDAMTVEDGDFANVAGAIVSTALEDVTVPRAKLYLLSTSEAQNLNQTILNYDFPGSASNGVWWLRSPGTNSDYASCVYGDEGRVDGTGYNIREACGVRPALKLDLSKAEFNSETKTFAVPNSGAYAGYVPAEADDATALAAKVVKFNGYDWYLIEDNSKSKTKGTVTLFAKECVGASQFGDNNTYSGSTLESYVNSYYADNFSAAAQAAVSEGLFILTKEQVQTIHDTNVDVLKCSQADGAASNKWWLSSSGSNKFYAAYVYGDDGAISSSGSTLTLFGVRPALKLDLSKVEFDSETKIFAVPTPGAYADYLPAATEDATALAAKVVKFNGYDWYLIKDNSKSETEGTVTLFAKDFIGNSKFDDSSDKYSESAVKEYLDNLTNAEGTFAGVADAIKTVETLTTKGYDSDDVYDTVSNVKLYLLSTSEAYKLPVNVRKCGLSGYWWLRSPGMNSDYAALVDGYDYNNGEVYEEDGRIQWELGVRPALRLDLSQVTFASVSLSGGANASSSGDSSIKNTFFKKSTIPEMTTITYTANEGYMFPVESDSYGTSDGITVTRTSDTCVTVSGTPTGVVNVTIPDAVLAHTHDDITFTAWTSTNSLPTDGGNYYLTNDVKLDNTWYAPNGAINLCLDGHSITAAEGKEIQLMDVENGATLNLYDKEDNSGSVSGAVSANGAILVNSGTFNMYGGTIKDNMTTDHGAGVRVKFGGTFSLYGGSIENNKTKNQGGNGGGVHVETNSTFNMSGGSIKNNTAFSSGGVFIGTNCTFNMSGGSITGNIATNGYGGVLFTDDGTAIFKLSGDVTISDNVTKIDIDEIDVHETHPSNMVIPDSVTIEVVDALTGEGKIYVQIGTSRVFTNSTGSVKAKDYIDKFVSDSRIYRIKTEGDELKIEAPYLRVGGTYVYDDNAADVFGDGKVKFTPANETTTYATLTLNGYQYDGTGDENSDGIIYLDAAQLRIVLKGENVVKATNPGIMINAPADTVISSDNGGSLEVVSKQGDAIYANGALTVESGTISATGANRGIAANGINLNGGKIVATGTGERGYGIYCERLPWLPDNSVSINSGITSLIASGTLGAVYGDVANALEGLGWSNITGTDGQEPIAVAAEARSLEYKKVAFVSHTHNFTYSVNAAGDTITATCDNADGECTLTDYKATLTIAAPDNLTYDKSAKAAVITDANDIQGAAKVQYQTKSGDAYGEATETAPTNAGTYKASITLGGATASVEYTIAKADPTCTAPTGLTATYGQTLADVTLTNPSGNTAGTWAWSDSRTSVGNVGTNTFKASFVPTDTTNYNTKTNIDVSVTVGKANQTAPAAPTEAGKTVNSITLNEIPNGEYKCGAGDWQTSPTFTGLDQNKGYVFRQRYAADANHNASAGSEETVIYTANHEHSFTYSSSNGTITATCNGAGTCSLTDNKVSFTLTAPTSLVYDGTDKKATLEGVDAFNAATGMNVSANGIVYNYKAKSSDSAVVVTETKNAGIYQALYTHQTGFPRPVAGISFTIAKADPTCTAPTGLTATYGQTLADVTLTNPSGNTAGTWAWADDTTSVGNVGTKTFKANFTPADTTNYNVVENVDVTVKVNPADITPTVTLEGWTYGDEANTPSVTGNTGNGGVAYTYAKKGSDSFSATVPTNAGNYTVKATIAATANYNGATATADFTIAKADPTYTVPTGLYATYGDTLADVTLPTGWAWADDTTSVGNVGTKTFKASFTPADTTNYNTVNDVDVTINVSKADPTYEAPKGLYATYGDTLADVTLPEGWAWVDDTTSVGNVGTKTFKANFTPADTTNYNVVENVDVTVKVNPADITPTITLDGWTYGDEANTPSVTGNAGNGDVAYTYAQKGSDEFSSDVPVEAGDYTVKAVIAETANYNGGEATADFTIAKAKVTITAEDKTIKRDAALQELTYNVDGKILDGDDLGIKVTSDVKAAVAGKYDIKVSYAENANYDVTTVDGIYTVTDRITATEKTAGKNKINSVAKATASKKGVTVKWGKVANAEKFVVYAGYCSGKYKKVKTVKGNVHSFNITKLNGKKLNLKKSVKIYVVAYRKVNGKYKKITKSITMHVVGKQNKKYSNAKAIKVKKSSYTLKVNKSATIKPTLVLQKKNKKAVEHVAKFRYQSTNKAVATVDKNGKIKTVGKGTCTIYIFANNGKLKSVKVTVK